VRPVGSTRRRSSVPPARLQHTSAGVQSIGVVHFTTIARDSSLAGESRIGIWQRLKQEKAMSKKSKLLIVTALIAVLGSSSQALARGGTFHLNSYYEQAENQ
jgi:hypothetical protein